MMKKNLSFQKPLQLNHSNPSTGRRQSRNAQQRSNKASPHQETVLAQDRLCDNE